MGLTARTPSARSSGGELGQRRGHAGLEVVHAHELGVQGEDQGGLGAPGVGVAAGHVGPPGQHVSTLGGERGDRMVDGFGVAAVAVHEHDARGPVGGTDQLDDHLGHRRGPDRQRAGEPGVLPAGADRERRSDDDVRPAAGQLAGEGLGDDRVGRQREVRPVLLAGADRDRQHRRWVTGGGVDPCRSRPDARVPTVLPVRLAPAGVRRRG